MPFKKIRYNTGEEIFKVKIENSDGSFLENWVFMRGDLPKWINIIKRKYGLDQSKDKDLDWAL